jgi:hypothetical protein
MRHGVRGGWSKVYLHRSALRNVCSVPCSMLHCSSQDAFVWQHELYPGRHFLFILDCDEQVEYCVAARNSIMYIVLNASWAQSSDFTQVTRALHFRVVTGRDLHWQGSAFKFFTPQKRALLKLYVIKGKRHSCPCVQLINHQAMKTYRKTHCPRWESNLCRPARARRYAVDEIGCELESAGSW